MIWFLPHQYSQSAHQALKQPVNKQSNHRFRSYHRVNSTSLSLCYVCTGMPYKNTSIGFVVLTPFTFIFSLQVNVSYLIHHLGIWHHICSFSSWRQKSFYIRTETNGKENQESKQMTWWKEKEERKRMHSSGINSTLLGSKNVCCIWYPRCLFLIIND